MTQLTGNADIDLNEKLLMYNICIIYHLTAMYIDKVDLWKVRGLTRFAASARINVS